MLKKKSFILLLVLAGIFTWGVTRLFQLRYEAGDVYPPYSSHRSDPLGTKALLESLDSLPRVSADRNYRPLGQLQPRLPQSIFFLGVDPQDLIHADRSDLAALENLLRGGNRLVLCLSGKPRSTFATTNASGSKTNPPVTSTPPGQPLPPIKKMAAGQDLVSLAKSWEFQMHSGGGTAAQTNGLETAALRVTQIPGLPHQMSWPGGFYFSSLGPEWKTVYQTTRGPVVIERTFGRGTLVLAGDSYLTSNESIRNSRQSAYLAWLCGSASEIIFDEAHFGLMAQPGVASLIRKYRLRPLLIGLVVLGLLFIWKNASSLVPRREGVGSSDQPATASRDSFHGFANLLRRGIPEKDLIQSCFTEWQKGALSDPRLRARLPEMVLVVEAEANKKILERDPVAAYAQLTKIVTERSQHARG